MIGAAATCSALMSLRSFPPRFFGSLRSKRGLIPEKQICLVSIFAIIACLAATIARRLRLIALSHGRSAQTLYIFNLKAV
jgi:hypothetical protein